MNLESVPGRTCLVKGKGLMCDNHHCSSTTWPMCQRVALMETNGRTDGWMDGWMNGLVERAAEWIGSRYSPWPRATLGAAVLQSVCCRRPRMEAVCTRVWKEKKKESIKFRADNRRGYPPHELTDKSVFHIDRSSLFTMPAGVLMASRFGQFDFFFFVNRI